MDFLDCSVRFYHSQEERHPDNPWIARNWSLNPEKVDGRRGDPLEGGGDGPIRPLDQEFSVQVYHNPTVLVCGFTVF